MVQRLKNSPSSLAFTSTSVELLVKQINACESQVKVQFITLVNCITTGKDQLAILKQIGNTFKENGGLHKKDDIHILSYMFLHCVSRHPMRRNLSSMFQSICEEYKNEFIHAITKMLDVLLEYDENSSFDVIRENVDTISSLMENFPTGDEVIQENNRLVLVYLDKALNVFFNSSRSEGSPVNQTKMMQHMLSTLKAIIAVLQKCEMSLWQQVTNETNIHHSEEYLSCINNIVTNSMDIMYNEFVTLECRCAAAMIFPGVFVHIPKCYGKCFVEFIYHGFKNTEPRSPIKSLEAYHPIQTLGPTDQHNPSCLNLSSTESRSTHYCDTEMTGICKILLESINNFFSMRLQLSSKLVLLHGLLVKLPEDVLYTEFNLNSITSLFEELFIDELINITLKSSGKHVLVLAFKTITLWIDKSRCIPNTYLQTKTPLSKLIVEKLLPHLILYVDHHIDTIRHNVNAAIKGCFTLLSSVDMDGLIGKCITEYFNGTLNTRGQISMLINICQFVSIQNILDIHKDLPDKIISLLGDVDLASHGCDLYAIICEKHLHEMTVQKIDVKNWIFTWVHILYSKLSVENNKDIKANIVNFIIPSILKIHSNIVVDILSDVNMNPEGEKVRAVIVFLKCLRGMKNYVNGTGISFNSSTYAYVNSNGDVMWKNMIRMVDMKHCLTHIDDQVRLDAISLICCSVKTTDPIDNEDIKLLQYFLRFNMSSENPSFRHQLLTNLKKFCSRMFNHAFQLAKQTMGVTDNKNILNTYGKFLTWLTHFIFKHLYNSAPYSQISTSLGLASIITEIFHLNKSSKLLNYYHLDEGEKQLFTDILIQCFSDTYDPNRIIVIDVFKQFPIYCSLSHINVEKIFKDAIVNLSSPKPDISSIAAYYITFLAIILKEKDVEILYNAVPSYHNDTCYHFIATKTNPTLALLDINMALLQKQLEITKSNLITGCQDAPLYGVLFCIRMLFQLQDIDVIKTGLISNESEKLFTTFLGDLIETGLDIIKIVSPYVSNDAPEGYLCDVSLLEIFKLLNLDEMSKANIEVEAHVARMLLVCCWRSMKEVSLLIGMIVSHFSNLTNKSSKHNLLPVSFIINIWNMFCDILLRSKHAGAYELASLGFIKLCSVLWSSYDEELRLIPANAVKSLVNDLLDPVPFDKAQVTRRSAGLPFYLEALCITEPLIKDKQSFKSLMVSLTDLCEHKMLQHDVNKLVISLNILRAFYKNTKLREDVFPYVSSGIIISINGFGSSNWAIRNSCTLLFSALMQRIFGVKKCKMTGREFFSRFPQLYSYLLDQLKSINEYLELSDRKKSACMSYHPSLFPVLLLLSHLYPSTIEASNSLMRLDKFIPYAMRCGSNAVYKTRTMAAKALVPLISLEKMEEILTNLIAQIQSLSQNSKAIDQNFVHGTLLQLKFVSERCFVLPTSVVNLKVVFERYISIYYYCLDSKMSFVIKSLYIDILNSFLQNGFTDPADVALPLCLHCLLLSTTKESKSISSPGYALLLRSAVQYMQTIFRLTKEFPVLEEEILTQLNNSAVKDKLVDTDDMVMLFTTSHESDVVFGMLEFVEVMITSCKISVKVGEILLNFICKSSIKDRCFSKALSTFGLVINQEFVIYNQHIPQVFKKVFGSSDSFSDELRSSVVKFCVTFILKLENSLEQKINKDMKFVLIKIWKFLDESSQSDQCESCREETVPILHVNPKSSVLFLSCKNLIYHYFNCCINLLKDSCLHIRDIASETLSTIFYESSCPDKTWYVPQPSVIIDDLFKEKIRCQLKHDPIHCTSYLISLMLYIDFFKLNDWLNDMETRDTEPSKEREVCNDKDLLKRFIVYEESKENPYYDLKEICEQSFDVLDEFNTSRDSQEEDSWCHTLISNIRSYYNCNSIIRKNDIGWLYFEKFAKIIAR